MLFNVTCQNIMRINIDGVFNLFSANLCTKLSRFKTLFLLTLFGRGQFGLGGHSTSTGIAALWDITKGMFPRGGGHNRLQKIPKSLTRQTLHGTLVNVF